MSTFDPEQHEKQVEQAWMNYYRREAQIDAFDKFIDLALDGVVTMDEAIQAFKEEYVDDEQ